ncbi:MAG: RIP metalloprotease RseP [bacterium]|nr:RIP metalloprotease RseP [bacterium]
MSFLYSMLAFGIVLGIIVLVHEFGHYFAARLMGVRVEVFSFGFGKRLFGKQIGETDFRFSLIPLGGYVKMAGEEEWDQENLKPYEFHAKNRGQKIFILFMGPFFNMLLAFLLFTLINLIGVEIEEYKQEPPRIGYVARNSPAKEVGLQPGDLVRSINGRDIPNWEELELTIASSAYEMINIEFERQGKIKNASVDVKSINRYDQGGIGIYNDFKTRVGKITEGLPAFNAKFKEGDIVQAVDGKPVCIYEFVTMMYKNTGTPMVFRIKRDNKILSLTVTPVEEAIDGVKKSVIGIETQFYSPIRITQYGLWGGMVKAQKDVSKFTFFIFTAFKKLIVGKFSTKQLAGPIEIAKFSQRALESGITKFLLLIAFISLQLGFVNLFPIPALDGGHLMIYSIESVIRREFSQQVKIVLMNIGFLLLITLMVFVILNDIANNLPFGWGSFWPF